MALTDQRRPTIYDVATLAGVSKSTAARALSGQGSVGTKARERAILAARQLGYEPNQLAVSMRSGRSQLVGLIVPDIANPFWAEVARGAQDRAVAEGLSLLCFSSDWRTDLETLHLRALVRARVDGAIISPVVGGTEALHAFGLPLVLMGSAADEFPGLPSVRSDVRQIVHLGLDHLVEMGHAAPALIVGPPQRRAHAQFVDAVGERLRDRGIEMAMPIEAGDYTVEGGHAAMLRVLAQPRLGHLAVFAANDLMALGAMMAVRDQGLDCPRDVSILGFDGIVAGSLSSPGLTTIEKPGRALGARALEMLVQAVEVRGSNEAVRLPGRLIVRGSVADLTTRTERTARPRRRSA